MFVVVCTSCRACNLQAVAIFDSEPTQEQVDEVSESIGGMWCIHSEIYDVSDGEIATGEMYS